MIVPGSSKGRDNLVSYLDSSDVAANICHGAGEFMAHDEASRAWLMATEDMQFPGSNIS